MCGRFDTSHLSWADVHAALSTYTTVRASNLAVEPNDDVRPTTQQLTARLEHGAGGPEWVLEQMRWGLVPHWRNGKPLRDTAKHADDGWKMTTFNARVETCAGASTFRDAYSRRRCIVPANAWYEWTGEKGSKVKHTFRRADGGPIWFAGLWDRVTTPDAGELGSFTILTGPAEGMLLDYHGRAPVILEREDWGVWLDPANDPAEVISAVRAHRFEHALA